MLEPLYEPQILPVLDKIEHDPGRRALWDAICDAIDLVCDHPDSAEARRGAIRVPSGAWLWKVPIRCYVEDDDWVLLWRPNDDDAVIAYIGPSLFR